MHQNGALIALMVLAPIKKELYEKIINFYLPQLISSLTLMSLKLCQDDLS